MKKKVIFFKNKNVSEQLEDDIRTREKELSKKKKELNLIKEEKAEKQRQEEQARHDDKVGDIFGDVLLKMFGTDDQRIAAEERLSKNRNDDYDPNHDYDSWTH
jgi:hypothetical protein